MNELIPRTGNYKALLSYRKADYLLYRQLERLERDFLEKGGFSERMTALRRKHRGY